MKLTLEMCEKDPIVRAFAMNCDIYLDGVLQEIVVEADEQAGTLKKWVPGEKTPKEFKGVVLIVYKSDVK